MRSGTELTFFGGATYERWICQWVGALHHPALAPQSWSPPSASAGIDLLSPGTGLSSSPRQQATHCSCWFLFLFFGYFQIFLSRSHPNVCATDVALKLPCSETCASFLSLSDESRPPTGTQSLLVWPRCIFPGLPVPLHVYQGLASPRAGPSQFPSTLAITSKPRHPSLPVPMLFFPFCRKGS